MDVRDIPLEKIVPSRNLRIEGTDDISELVESIKEHGLLQPIRVRSVGGGVYQIIAGNRRFLAHRALGRPTISAVVVEETDRQAAIQGIVENLQREDLTPLELAQGIRELTTGFGLTTSEMARAISKSEAQVRTWIRLSRLPEDVLGRLDSGDKGTQTVTGLTPRNIQPFVSDLPSEEEIAGDPSARALYEERVSTVRQLLEDVDARGIRINAHMADEVARRTRSGQMTLSEAIDEVLAHPEQYRYARPTSEELAADTFAAYVQIHRELASVAYRLRPEIAASFSPEQKRDLLDRYSSHIAALEPYRKALESEGAARSEAAPQLESGQEEPR